MGQKTIIHPIYGYKTYRDVQYQKLNISYQVFGKELGKAPVIIVIHALTGNSDVTNSKSGWWKPIVGEAKLIDTKRFTVLSFDILGNGFSGSSIENYKDFIAKDIANLFIQVLHQIGIKKLHTVIGGSLGGGIAWEMAVLKPSFIEYLIPIAADWKATDWIIGHNHIQEQLLKSKTNALENARMMAMLFYRTPASFSEKFARTKTRDKKLFNVESWLDHHGNKLASRYKLSAYKMMNHLLSTIDVSLFFKGFEAAVKNLKCTVIQIAIDSDLFFSSEENKKTKQILTEIGINNQYHEINSIHGHDAFLIEFEQIIRILKPVFSNLRQQN